MRFNHLNVPDQWQHYWSKYPNGYTILEALLNWVNQVDNMVDNVNNWNEYLEKFVETFDEKLKPHVREQLQEWVEDGTLADIINEEVFQDLNNLINEKGHSILKFGNDDVAFQTAFNTLPEGSKIHVPAGTYIFNALVTSTRKIHVQFEKGAVIKLAPNKNHGLLKFDGIDGLVIKGLTVNGDKANQTASSGQAVQIAYCKNVLVEDADISYHWGNGLFVNNSERVQVVRGKFYDNTTTNGVFQDCTHSQMVGCYSWGSNGFGLQMKYQCRNCDFIGCHSFNNKREGFNIIDGVKYLNVMGCHSYGNGDGGFVFGEDFGQGLPSNISVESCFAYENKYDGINLNNPYMENFRIVNNECFNNNDSSGADASHRHGIFISNYSKNILIQNNRCYDNQTTKTQEYGIFLGAGTEVTIGTNDLEGNALGRISEGTSVSCNNRIAPLFESPTELLKNPSFKTWDLSLPDNWVNAGSVNPSIKVDDIDFGRLLEITSTAAVSYIRQDITYTDVRESRLTFSIDVYCTTPGGARIGLYSYPGSTAIASLTTHKGTGWERLIVSRPVKTGFNNVFVRCEVLNGSTGRFKRGSLKQSYV